MTLQEKLENKTAHIAIVGLGYVGLPLAVEFAKAGFCVGGFDLDQRKIDEIMSGRSYIPDVSTEDIKKLVDAKMLVATTDFSALGSADTVTICVPTPLKKTKDPDLSYILSATETIAKWIHPNMLVTLESTTYPGTTEELVVPLLTRPVVIPKVNEWYDATGRKMVSPGISVMEPEPIETWTPKLGEDLFICFSPERVDPGNPNFQTRNIPKVVGGATPRCTEIGTLFYQQAVDTVVPVQSTTTAEMVKLLENTFRMINIGLVNELAVMCSKMGINIWDVIDAAKTKPFGFMPFYPGPGLGGHCIPIDPFYLSWKSKQYGCEPRFIELAGVVNAHMPHFVIEKIQDALNKAGKPINGSHIHIYGMAYKKNIDDVRESPALDIVHLLQQKGARLITYYDPYIPEITVGGVVLKSEPYEWSFSGAADCVLIATDHSCFNYGLILNQAKLIVDTRNALKGLTSSKIVRL